MQKKKIVVTDDEENIRRIICDFLINEGYETLEAESGEQTLEYFNSGEDISLYILDVMLDKKDEYDGWKICKIIKEKSNVPVLILTARSQEFDELKSFESGADEYVQKPVPSFPVLMKRVGALIRRSEGTNRKNLNTLALDELEIDEKAHIVTLKNEHIELTLKEYGLINLFMHNINRVFTRENLLVEIWGENYSGDARTVDSHITRLRTKLGDWGYLHLKTVYGVGYKIEADINE